MYKILEKTRFDNVSRPKNLMKVNPLCLSIPSITIEVQQGGNRRSMLDRWIP
jgi:hypothetical protein